MKHTGILPSLFLKRKLSGLTKCMILITCLIIEHLHWVFETSLVQRLDIVLGVCRAFAYLCDIQAIMYVLPCPWIVFVSYTHNIEHGKQNMFLHACKMLSFDIISGILSSFL